MQNSAFSGMIHDMEPVSMEKIVGLAKRQSVPWTGLASIKND